MPDNIEMSSGLRAAFAAREVKITDEMKKILRTMRNEYKAEHRLVVRASIILHAAHGRSNA